MTTAHYDCLLSWELEIFSISY